MVDFIKVTNGKKVFPLGDTHKDSRFGYMQNIGYGDHQIGAIFSGEKRSPRKGEWYLSGAKITAYKAPNDLDMSFHLAKIVKIEKTVEYKITEYPGN